MALLMLGAVLAAELAISHRFGIPEWDFVAEWGKMRDWLSLHARPGRRSGGSWIYPYGTPAAEWAVIIFYMVGGAALVLLVFRRLSRMGERHHLNRKLAWEIITLILLALITQNAYRLSDWVSEVRLWRYTVMEEPRSLLGWNNLGKAYMERKRYDLAAQAYDKTVELDPDGAENYRNLGIALSLMGDYKKAKPAYEKAIELAPGDMGSRNNLANILVVEADRNKNPGGYKDAVQHYLKILEYDPANAHAHYNLAWCYYMLGALGEAERENMRALHLNPQYDKARWLREQIIKARRNRQQLPGME
jgi:tetratricopeptide (TPR) repeat protein